MKPIATNIADLSNIRETGLLFQTGYLTIADCDAGLFTLRVPDEEVRQDLAALVAGAYAGKDAPVCRGEGGEALIVCHSHDP